MEKVIIDGKVAVLVSAGFGAGWSSWNYQYPEMLFDPTIVKMLDEGKSQDEILAYCEVKYPEGYFGGAEDLVIEWMPMGTEFEIDEYDGSESIRYKENEYWITA